MRRRKTKKEVTSMWGRRLRSNSKEKVKDQKDDVKSENEVFEAKPSSSFSGFGFNQLSDPLVFPELRSGAWSTCQSSQKKYFRASSPSVFESYIIGIQSEKHENEIVLKKIQYFSKTSWNKSHHPLYWKSCDMIAMKREVAANAKT